MVAGTTYARWPTVSINGVQLDASRDGFLEEVVIDDDLDLPAMFALTLRTTGLDTPPLEIGSTVEIAAPGGLLSGLFDKPLLTGEVTSLSGDFDRHGRRIHVRGYDVAHRLHRGRKTRTFVNVTDSDICRRVADAAGVDVGTIDPSTSTHEHVSQANQTDWDFLKGRARLIGFALSVDEGKLNFRRPAEASSAPSEGDLAQIAPFKLVFGQELVEYRPRLTSSEQVASVEVRGWDRRTKREIVGRASSGTTAAQPSGPSLQTIAQAFGDSTFVQVAHPVASVEEADHAAGALAERIGSAFAEAEGTCRGNTDLRAGAAVNISGVSDAFTGRFVLSHTRHVFNHDGYWTHFTISGRQQRSLLGLVSMGGGTGSAAASGAATSQRVSGLVLAIVTANDDPSEEGRVKLEYPWLSADYESNWAPLVQLGAGPASGAVFIPEVGDEVLVGFEFGDLNRPYVIGSLYNGVDKPALGSDLFDNGAVKRRGIVSRKGHRLVFFDSDQKSGIGLLTKDGKLRIALNDTTNELRIFGDPKVVIEAARQLDLKSRGNLSIRAEGSITIKGGSVVDIDGSVIQLN